MESYHGAAGHCHQCRASAYEVARSRGLPSVPYWAARKHNNVSYVANSKFEGCTAMEKAKHRVSRHNKLDWRKGHRYPRVTIGWRKGGDKTNRQQFA